MKKRAKAKTRRDKEGGRNKSMTEHKERYKEQEERKRVKRMEEEIAKGGNEITQRKLEAGGEMDGTKEEPTFRILSSSLSEISSSFLLLDR